MPCGRNTAQIGIAHTGQTYTFGAARLRILRSMEDTVHRSGNINTSSLVIRMELAGQGILWTADAYCDYARLVEKYGDEQYISPNRKERRSAFPS